jgi:hypothetical protein
MKSFNQFIGESKENWPNWRVLDSLSREQCKFIEEWTGPNPQFIFSGDNWDDFELIDNLTNSRSRRETLTGGRKCWVTRYEPFPGLSVIFIEHKVSPESEYAFVIGRDELEHIKENGEDDWMVKSLFKDF